MSITSSPIVLAFGCVSVTGSAFIIIISGVGRSSTKGNAVLHLIGIFLLMWNGLLKS
jgi:hypothetical protein